MTWLYAAVHFLVDGVCAWAMLGRLGAVLDRLGGRKMPMAFAWTGCALTLLGVWLHPAVLGLGNALFHVGGGADVIRDGGRCERLGIFVAPGALGLYVGGLLAGKVPWLLILAGAAMGLLLWFVRCPDGMDRRPSEKSPVSLTACCFLVVVLRSFVGFQVVFSWKSGWLAFAAVLAVVLGKMAGGLMAARFGCRTVTVCSLTGAAVCYALGSIPAFGLLALLAFNMTMPLTLYALWRRFPDCPGSVFGSLTLALFVGFLPTYFGINLPIGGVLGSILSLLLLWKAVGDD